MVSCARQVLVALVASAGFAALVALPAQAAEYPPSTSRWVEDIAGVIDDADEAAITEVFQSLETQTGVNAMAVAIGSVGDYQSGGTIEEFATGLFNHWGIGDAGIDDGVLLVVAVEDRRARVVIGDGFAGRYVDEAQAVVDAMLGHFGDGRYSGAIRAGAEEISARFRSLGDGSSGGGGIPGGALYALGGGGAALLGAGGLVTWQRIRPRHCPQCSNAMQRLNGREAKRPYLDPGQNREEDLESVEYDVFQCTTCGAHKVERHGKVFSRYKLCPKCAYRTMSTVRRTVRAATYDRGGADRITKTCRHCDYHDEYKVSTPKERRPTTSSSSEYGSSSHDGSGSGGGGSSGRGASGSW